MKFSQIMISLQFENIDMKNHEGVHNYTITGSIVSYYLICQLKFGFTFTFLITTQSHYHVETHTCHINDIFYINNLNTSTWIITNDIKLHFEQIFDHTSHFFRYFTL